MTERRPSLAERLGRLHELRTAPPAISIPTAEPLAGDWPPGCQAFPASFAQARLWFLHQLQPDLTAYHLPLLWRLSGAVAIAALQEALTVLIDRHSTLRTSFQLHGSDVVQILHPTTPCALDIEPLGDRDPEVVVRQWLEQEAMMPLDLSSGRLLRARLLQVAEREHLLLLNHHHIASDAWSRSVLARDLAELYNAERSGRSPQLEPLAIHYSDYAVWQRQRLRGERLQELSEFWIDQLRDLEPLELPSDHLRPVMPSYRGESVSFQIEPELLEPFEALCRREGATLQMGLLAVVALLLHRYSRQDDFTIGVPIWGRNHPELEKLIGFFINTLPIRTRFEPGLSFRQLLALVRESSIRAYEHQELPFEQMVDALNFERDTSRNPLVQVMLQLIELPEAGLEQLDGLSVQSLPSTSESAKFDLSFDLRRSADQGLSASITYATDLFDGDRIERLRSHLIILLSSVVQAPDQPVAALNLLAEAERELIESWQQGPVVAVPELCVHELFEQQVERTPNAIAVVFGEQELSYGELNVRANHLAHHLIDCGVGPDVIVAVCLERSIELMVGLLAILKAGGAYLPMDPAYPEERLAFMVDETAPVALLVHGATRERLEALAGGLPLVDLEADAAAWPMLNAANPDPYTLGLRPNHLAYVIYTSGSTGRPKGVMVEHRNLTNHTIWQSNVFVFSSEDVVLQRTSVSFDAAVWELWTPLSIGARLVLLTNEQGRDPQQIACAIARQQVSIVQFVPSLLQALLSIPAFAQRLNCRYVFCGGEPLSGALAIRARRVFGGGVVNLYGPTEATIDATWWDGSGATFGEAAPIGRPIANTSIFLLDAEGQSVPIGVAGELHIGGAGVARGYLNRPELTAERYQRNPHAAEPNERMYRTGDLARWLPDGNLEYIGRADSQIKLRGFRIEPGEIEANLLVHPAVAQAAVVLRQDDPANPRLVAYWVPSDRASSESGSAKAEPLRAFLSQRLPDYLMPATFVELGALPLTANGKLDRNALPAPSFSGEQGQRVEPSSGLEHQLHGLWAEVLGHSDFGVTDNFFRVGGHSLAAARLVSRIEQALGAAPPLSVLFQHPTIAHLAAGIPASGHGSPSLCVPESRLREQRAQSGPSLITTEPLVGDWQAGCRAFPASFAQARLWFLHQLVPELCAYHLPFLWRLSGDLDMAALRRALSDLIERHPTLRTSFQMVGDAVVQLVHLPAPFPLEVEPLAGRDGDGVIDSWLEQEATTPFDLRSGLLLRARLLRVAEREHWLLLNHHHIASDGWSVSVLWRDLLALYNAHRNGTSPELRPLGVHYQDYAAWQRQRLGGSLLQALKSYWINVLSGLQPLELPGDHPRPATPSYRGESVSFQIEREQLESFEALCRAEGATLQMGLLALLALLLHRYSRQEDFAIGVPTWGRNHPDLEPLIGFFVNTLPIRMRFSGEVSFRQLLAHVKASSIAAYEHQELPFEQMVEALQPERDRSRNPLVQVMLQLTELPDAGRHQLDGLEVESLVSSGRSAHLDLEVFLRRHRNGGLQGRVSFATDLFEADRIERLAAHLITLLGSATATPDATAATLNLLPEAEAALIEGWQQGPTFDFPELCIHQLFEQQVERSPEAIAVVFEDQQLTYSELNSRANRLAHQLIDQGVGPDVLVGICVERSLAMVIGLLAILKAGGAYVPLDPADPIERLSFMLEDSAVRILLTQREHLPLLKMPAAGALLICLTDAGDPGHQHSAANPLTGVKPGNLAYMIYTSGSTGTPKGALNAHAGVCNRLWWMQQEFGLSASDCILQKTPYSFDVSVWEFFWTLGFGGRLLIARPGGHRDQVYLRGLIEQEGVTMLHFVPSMLESLVEAFPLGAVSTVKRVFCSGEALSVASAKRFFEVFPHGDLHNLYGPTEAAIDVSHWCCKPDSMLPTVPLGRPIANTQLLILNAYLQPVPVGVAGELHIGGVQVGRGYWNRPQLTADRFITNPFVEGLLYKTGDLARFLPDGTIDYLGRLDHQIKLRGFRIEPGEIEANLQVHPAVDQAAVVLRHDDPANPRLVAYWVPQATTAQQLTAATTSGAPLAGHGSGSDESSSSPGPLRPEQFRSFLSQRLPEHMVPAAFVELEALPLTSNGKLDRRALPAPSYSGDQERRVEPSTDLERQLHGLWAEVLGHGAFGVSDNFFLVGGHSLSSARLTALIEQRLGHRVPLSVLFQQPTLRELSQWLADADPPADSRADGPVGPVATAADRPAAVAAAIDGPANTSGYRSLVTLQARGEAPGLFVVHGGNGDVYIHLHLARCLAPHRPVFGLQAVGFDGSAALQRSVAEMAAHYADEILRFQPTGPYHLLGYSGGGWYAWAVAAELRRRGATPGLIGLVDTGSTADLHRRVRLRQLIRRQLQRLPRRARALVGGDPGRWPAALAQKREALRYLAWTMLRPQGGTAPQALDPEARPRPTQPLRGDYFLQLHTYYRPPRLPLRVDVFASRGQLQQHEKLWNFYARGRAMLHPCLEDHEDYYNADLMPEFAVLLETIIAEIEAGAKA